jgi:hypothetical protein
MANTYWTIGYTKRKVIFIYREIFQIILQIEKPEMPLRKKISEPLFLNLTHSLYGWTYFSSLQKTEENLD